MTLEEEPLLAPPMGAWITPRPARGLEVLQRLVGLPKLVSGHRDLVLTTLKRDLSARFQGTLLGWAWPILQPLLLFAIYYFIFTRFLGQRMPALPESQQAGMGVYMFCAMISWGALGESLGRGTSVIVDNGNLIKKLAFPSELLPLNVVLASLVMMLFGVAIFIAVCFTSVWPRPGLALAWIPLIVVLQGLFTYGIVLFLTTLHVFLRDTAQVVGMVTTVWMFLTPVFWVPELLSAGPGGASVEQHMGLIHANPAYHLVSAWRGALMGDVSLTLESGVLTPVSVAAIPGHLGVFALWALGAYVLGYAFFVHSQRRFADEV
ncbi:MAG: ABC transporter permease [Planctomycetes bacterium]|nr:ABC transporter permease [Planctomycetota bacterium]